MPPLTRRSLTRAAGHAVWTLPLVELATSAPALAASGPGGAPLVLTQAIAWWSDAGLSGESELYVRITVANQSSLVVPDVRVTLVFPPDYSGPRGARTPGYGALENVGDGWVVGNTLVGGTVDHTTLVSFTRDALGAGATATIGPATPTRPAFGILWGLPTPPTTETVVVQVTATGHATVSGVLAFG